MVGRYLCRFISYRIISCRMVMFQFSNLGGNTMKIAVILPSRGLMFSRTADELLQNLEGYDYEIFFAHGLSIPECFIVPLNRALKGDFTHVWFVEDDMILPEETLSAMLLMDSPVVTMDYPVSRTGQGAVFSDKAGRVIFSGTGCLLVKREVFDKLKKPYFRTDIKWNVQNYGDFIRMTANLMPNVAGYGLHDVTFGIKLWKAGIPISVAGKIGQRKLKALGKPGTNEGAHQIENWTKLKPNYLYKKYKKMPVQPTGILVEVQTLAGPLMVHPDKAKKMYKTGMAARIPKQSVTIDYNEVDL